MSVQNIARDNVRVVRDRPKNFYRNNRYGTVTTVRTILLKNHIKKGRLPDGALHTLHQFHYKFML